MNVEEIVHNLPTELKLAVLYLMVRAPKAHFLKPFKTYNGGLSRAPHGFPGVWRDDGEPGVEEVSPLSGTCKLSKVFMEINVGKSSFPSGIGRGEWDRSPASGLIRFPSTTQSLVEATRY